MQRCGRTLKVPARIADISETQVLGERTVRPNETCRPITPAKDDANAERAAVDRRAVLALAALGATGAAMGATALVRSGKGGPASPPPTVGVRRELPAEGSVPSTGVPSTVAPTTTQMTAPPTTAGPPSTRFQLGPILPDGDTSGDGEASGASQAPVQTVVADVQAKSGSETNFGVPVPPADLPAPVAESVIITAGVSVDDIFEVIVDVDPVTGEPLTYGRVGRDPVTGQIATHRGVALPIDKGRSPVGQRSHAKLLAARATFGPTPGLIGAIDSMGPEVWLDKQLAPATIPDTATDQALSGFWLLDADHDQAFDNNNTVESQVYWSTVARALSSERQLQEVMVQFWREHFSIALGMGQQPHYLFLDRAIRQNCFGRFQDLLRESAHNVGMLVYLNNDTSNAATAKGVNENYGRELLELHTLGIHDGEHVYSEDDVVSAAKVMSGFTTRWGPWSDFVYKPEFHYNGPISFLNGQWSTPGNGGDLGYDDAIKFLRFLSRHASTARFICTKLVRYFVDEDAPESLVDSATAIYLANQTLIAPVLRHILLSVEFQQSQGQRAKRGFEWVVSALRATEAQVDVGAEWHSWNDKTVPGYLNVTGHSPWGWSAPNGFPVANNYWISTSFLQTRWSRSPFIAQGNGLTMDFSSILPAGSMRAADYAVALGKRLCGKTITQAEIDAFLSYIGAGPNLTIGASSITNPEDVIAMFFMFPTFQLRG